MAQSEKTPWEQAIDDAFEQNEGTDLPTTIWALSRVLAAQEGATQNAENWRRTIRRIRKNSKASERNAMLIADALGIDRHALPQSSERLTVQMVQARLELAEDDHARLRKQFDSFVEATTARLARLEAGGENEAQR